MGTGDVVLRHRESSLLCLHYVSEMDWYSFDVISMIKMTPELNSTPCAPVALTFGIYTICQ
jgi:hypothetical protein